MAGTAERPLEASRPIALESLRTCLEKRIETPGIRFGVPPSVASKFSNPECSFFDNFLAIAPAHNPIVPVKVSKYLRGLTGKHVKGKELRGIDSVKRVSIF